MELLQLVNLRPLTLVEVHRIVEECEERMGEEEILRVLDVIREMLPEGPNQRRGKEEGGEERWRGGWGGWSGGGGGEDWPGQAGAGSGLSDLLWPLHSSRAIERLGNIDS